MTNTISVSTDAPVAQITLDRPKVLNAINGELAIELRDTFERLDDDEEVLVVHIMGRGESFSSGFDLNELKDDMGGMSYENFERHAGGKRALQDLSRLVDSTDMIVVSTVEGNTLGAGLELAVISDIAVAAESATLGFPETEIGLSITNGVTNLLPRAVGLQRAKLLVLTGERISGQEAATLGLVAEAVPDDEVENRSEEIIESLLEKSPSGLVAAKHLLNYGREGEYEDSLERELNAGLRLLQTEEYQHALGEFFDS
ncbi:enoyl-CoA hydratase/isomerase family protein [Halomarina litorea]|uniref:enoyl-CoA hydratase/isomerase family protein n=1 Tax=Halomarina litorea TaxID=2961595 RepID=UPI0020C33BAF|nr:enoyl-CoA hydratase/isomerase family protein [Halomarina sp. BCD28]